MPNPLHSMSRFESRPAGLFAPTLALALLLLLAGTAHAGAINFRWDYTSSGAAGFALHCGTSSRSYTVHIDAGNSDSATVTTLAEGKTHYCAVTAYGPGTGESAYSNEVSVYVPVTSGQQTLWSPSERPANPDSNDTAPVNLGMRFRSTQAGYITGVRFYKAAANTGRHIATLWTAAGQKLAEAAFANETASGWQQVNFAAPVPISANSVYVASYFAPVGRWSFNDSYFTSSRTSGPLVAPASTEGAPNGVYTEASGPAFPSSTWNAENYWVDVVFKPGP